MPTTTRQRTTSTRTDNATHETRGRTRVSSQSKKSSPVDSARLPASESTKRHKASGVTSYDHRSYQDSKPRHRRHSAQDTSHAKTSRHNQRLKNPSTLFPSLPTEGRIINELSAPDGTAFVRRTSYRHKPGSSRARAPADVVLAFNVPGPTQTTRTSIHWRVPGSKGQATSDSRPTRQGKSGDTARGTYSARKSGSRSRRHSDHQKTRGTHDKESTQSPGPSQEIEDWEKQYQASRHKPPSSPERPTKERVPRQDLTAADRQREYREKLGLESKARTYEHSERRSKGRRKSRKETGCSGKCSVM